MIETVLDRVNRWLGVALAASVGLMMAVTFVDVVGRQVFDRPLPAAFEFTRILLGLMVFVGLPVVTGHNEHITIGLFNGLFRPRAQRIKRAIVAMICAGLTVFLAWELWKQAAKLDKLNEKFMFLQIKLAPFVYVMAALSVLTVFVFLARAAVELKRDAKEELIGV